MQYTGDSIQWYWVKCSTNNSVEMLIWVITISIDQLLSIECSIYQEILSWVDYTSVETLLLDELSEPVSWDTG